MDAVWAVAGLVLMGAAVLDVWLSVLHPDAEGPFAKLVRRGVWWLATSTGGRFPALRRRALVLAGPVLMAATFLLWISLLMVGVGLVVWSMIDEYAAHPDLGELSFVDALYYAGVTVTVLGPGETTPLSTPGKLLAPVASGTGFVLLTGITAYLIEVVSGLSARDRFTLAVLDDARDDGGAEMLADCLAEEGVAEVRQRCRGWAEQLRAVDETVHRYPLVVFTYRSRRPEYDPEPALARVAEVTVAALLAADLAAGSGLRTMAEALSSALTRMQRTIAEKYLPAGIGRQLADPAPAAEDIREVARICGVLTGRLGEGPAPPKHRSAAEVAFRSRVLLDGLRQWSRAGPDQPR